MTKGRKTTGVIFKITKKKDFKGDVAGDEVDGEAVDITETAEPEMEGQTTIFDQDDSNERKMTAQEKIDFFRDVLVDYKDNKWKITDKQILEIGNKVEEHLYQAVQSFDNFPSYKRDLTWMNFIMDMIKKASAEKAKNIYPFLTSQWERYIDEIETRDS